MFARGDSAAMLSQTCTAEAGRIHDYLQRQGIEKQAQVDKMIPLNGYTKNGRRVMNTDARGVLLKGRRCALPRLNSAPELHRPELPPILMNQSKSANSERRNRPLTPLVANSSRGTRSLPKNYRINLDLVPLVEVGQCIGNLSITRRRQSLSSNDSCFSSSSPSPRLMRRSSSPRPPSEVKDDLSEVGVGSQKRRNSAESLEEVESDNEEADAGKDTMILRWLQTVEKTHEVTPTTGELLPCITEGKLT